MLLRLWRCLHSCIVQQHQQQQQHETSPGSKNNLLPYIIRFGWLRTYKSQSWLHNYTSIFNRNSAEAAFRCMDGSINPARANYSAPQRIHLQEMGGWMDGHK